MSERCAAALPATLVIDDEMMRSGWVQCGQPATAVHRYACVHEHVVEKATCDEHAPEPGTVGCLQCFDAGHECEMRAELIEALT